MHASTPETGSVPAKPIATAWLYQPFASAARAGLPPVTVGAVASYLSWWLKGALTLPALSVQVPGTDAAAPSGPL